MLPPQKAVIQCFQYRDMLKSGKVATVSELAAKVKQERAFLCRALSLLNLAFGHHRRHPQRSRTRHTHSLQTPKKLPRKAGPSRGGFFEWSEKIKTTPSRRWYRQPDTGFEWVRLTQLFFKLLLKRWLFCLIILATRKRVYVFLKCHLFHSLIFG